MKNRCIFVLFVILGIGTILAAGTGLAADNHQKKMKAHHQGNSCEECHGVQNPDKPADDQGCLECHDSGQHVAQLTAGLEYNPHDSPHYGTEVDCTACHREHSPSEVMCYECHLFRFRELD